MMLRCNDCFTMEFLAVVADVYFLPLSRPSFSKQYVGLYITTGVMAQWLEHLPHVSGGRGFEPRPSHTKDF